MEAYFCYSNNFFFALFAVSIILSNFILAINFQSLHNIIKEIGEFVFIEIPNIKQTINKSFRDFRQIIDKSYIYANRERDIVRDLFNFVDKGIRN